MSARRILHEDSADLASSSFSPRSSSLNFPREGIPSTKQRFYEQLGGCLFFEMLFQVFMSVMKDDG